MLVQDTAWPGYEEIPAWIVEGYATIFAELGVEPDVVVLPVGVGSFATAAVRALPGAKAISVEPADAACLLESLEAGEPVEAPAPHRSIMAGLNAGRVSTAAWPVLREAVDVAVAVGDDTAIAGMRTLAQLGIRGGECSGAVVGAAAELLSGSAARRAGRRRGRRGAAAADRGRHRPRRLRAARRRLTPACASRS